MPVKLTQDEFIKKAKVVHGERYDYSSSVYINCYEHIVIKCSVHGEFKQRPSKHLVGHGCLHCADASRSKNSRLKFDDFLKRAINIHGNRYEYIETVLEKVTKKIPIICPFHGVFLQNVNNHLSGNGCPKCNFRKSPIKTLKFTESKKDEYQIVPFNFYVIRLHNEYEKFLKVGITSNLKNRYRKKLGFNIDVLLEYPTNMYEAKKIENFILNELHTNTYKPLKKFNGQTECLIEGSEDLILLKIKEFLNNEDRSDLVAKILEYEYR